MLQVVMTPPSARLAELRLRVNSDRTSHLSQGVRHRAEGCVALGWLIASVVKYPLGAPDSTSLYICLPPVWGAAGGDQLISITRRTKMDTKKTKVGPLDLKENKGSSKKPLKETPQQGTGSSGKPRSGPAATSVPAGGTSAEGRDKPMARHLPEVKTKIALMGVSLTDTPLQGASTSSKPAVEKGQGRLVPQTGELRPAKKALSGSVRRKLKKTRAGASEARTGKNQDMQADPSQGRPRPNPPRGQGQRAIHPPRWRENQKGPWTYTEALTATKMAIFKELHPEDKLNEDDQWSILDVLG
jgi:hypothetical protein